MRVCGWPFFSVGLGFARDVRLPNLHHRSINAFDELACVCCADSLYDVVHSSKYLTLVFEYLDQDLKKYLDGCEGGIEPRALKSFLFQLIRGVAYCHHHRVLHR